MDIAAVLTQIIRLSPDDRIRLVQAILNSLSTDIDSVDLTEKQQQELARRLLEHQANPIDVVRWSDVKARTDKAVNRLSEEISQTTDRVLLQQEADGTTSATLLGWSDCQAFGKTRDEAIRELRELVNAKLARAEIVPIQLMSTQPAHPLLSIPISLRQNPLFDEVIGYMESYRRELDAETEVSERVDYQPERLIWAYVGLRDVVQYLNRFAIADFNLEAYSHYKSLRRQKIRIGTQDLKIASIVLACNAILVKFVQFQRGEIICIVNANRKLSRNLLLSFH
ncbi:MAG: addiction module protein [Cyanobacteriota bacterium]|nr:addiction module protein [Cyanobacteriota bacterium]